VEDNVVIMMRRIAWFLLRGLGVPEGEPADFYRDLALVILFIPTSIAVIIRLPGDRFDKSFWICAAIAAGCLLLAKRRLALCAATIGFMSVRLLLGGLFTANPVWLVAGAVLGTVVLMVVHWEGRKPDG
jgi:hypothetical protein